MSNLYQVGDYQLTGAEVDTLHKLYSCGGQHDGDLPSKSGMLGLMEKKLAYKAYGEPCPNFISELGHSICRKHYEKSNPDTSAHANTSDEFPKQQRYQDASGEDWLDEFARTSTPEEFRGAMRFTIGKYNRRMGRKDDELAEVTKMADYCQRWREYLQKMEAS